MRNTAVKLALIFLAVLHMGVIFAGFVTPYSPESQHRQMSFAPPTPLHFADTEGHWRFPPVVHPLEPASEGFRRYVEDRSRSCPVRILVQGEPYKFLGWIPFRWRLFGVDAPCQLFLFGTDGFGRDQFSRLVYGGRISLLAGFLAAALALSAGLVLGILAGFYGGWVDEILMRGAELFLALPWLYLLFAVRAFLPLHISSVRTFFLLIAVIGLVGWARPARLIRGVVLSAREREFVLAAKGFGASDFYLLGRHIAPQTFGVVLAQATLLIPQFILAEVSLSFLGLGAGEPAASWGNMLAVLQQYHVLVSYWWMFIPGGVLVLVLLSYLTVANYAQRHRKLLAI